MTSFFERWDFEKVQSITFQELGQQRPNYSNRWKNYRHSTQWRNQTTSTTGIRQLDKTKDDRHPSCCRRRRPVVDVVSNLQASMVLFSRILVVFFVLTRPTSIKAKPHCMAVLQCKWNISITIYTQTFVCLFRIIYLANGTGNCCYYLPNVMAVKETK